MKKILCMLTILCSIISSSGQAWVSIADWAFQVSHELEAITDFQLAHEQFLAATTLDTRGRQIAVIQNHIMSMLDLEHPKNGHLAYPLPETKELIKTISALANAHARDLTDTQQIFNEKRYRHALTILLYIIEGDIPITLSPIETSIEQATP